MTALGFFGRADNKGPGILCYGQAAGLFAIQGNIGSLTKSSCFQLMGNILERTVVFVCLVSGCAQDMWKFPEEGLNPPHSSDLSHSSDNAGSFNCYAVRELLDRIVHALPQVAHLTEYHRWNSPTKPLPMNLSCFLLDSLSFSLSFTLGNNGSSPHKENKVKAFFPSLDRHRFRKFSLYQKTKVHRN